MKKIFTILSLTIFANLITFSQSLNIHKNTGVITIPLSEIDSITFVPADIVSDFDGNIYNVVTIGNQVWMKENLKTTHYRDGSAIPNETNGGTWGGLTTGAYCYYDNDTANGDIYGPLYNWYAVADNRNLCPIGWHVPTDAEWKTLEIYLGMTQTQADGTDWRGTDQGNQLKEAGNTHWFSPNAGTNSSGFTALPGGDRYIDGVFRWIGDDGVWWSATEDNATHVWRRVLSYDNAKMYRDSGNKEIGYSVRCLKD